VERGTVRVTSCPRAQHNVPGPGGVLVEIFGGGVPPISPNPDPISDQKMPFPTLVFRPGLKKSIPVFRPHLVHD